MSCGDTKMTSTSKSGAASGAAATKAAPTAGVSLGAAIERLLYFNGRFLKAEDLRLEQTGYLTRIALAERAQGAGVSYGFHVTAQTSAAPSNFVTSVADAVFAKMRANRTEWAAFLDDAEEGQPPIGDDALIKRLASALDALCGAEPGTASGVVLTIAPGHAADGLGRDLLLDHPHQLKLSQLIEAFTAAPTATDAPGPAITPKPLTSAPPLTGAFLLTLQVDPRDHGNVPVYGVQCTDAKTAACSLGYRADGVAAQLVFFDALDGAVAASDWWTWRGMGARAYFEKETEARPSLLPGMLGALPFSAAAKAPETGTHVPIGMVYLRNGSFVAFDPWTAKRLRSPGELTYWLRALRYPAQVSQLARVLQFQSQLTDALSGGVASGAKSLWQLGFGDGAELVLPGVGFLPIPVGAETRRGLAVSEATLTPILDDYFDGVPYELMPATEGELNALFVGALESGELRLRRPLSGSVRGEPATVTEVPRYRVPEGMAVTRVERTAAAARRLVINEASRTRTGAVTGAATGATAGNESGGVIELHGNIEERGTLPIRTAGGAGKVFVWYTPNPFPGYVMFTWPAPLPQATTAAPPRVCTQTRLVPIGPNGPMEEAQFEVLAHDGEWASYFEASMGSFFELRGLRLELEQASAGLGLDYQIITQSGSTIGPGSDGWLMLQSQTGDEVVGLRISLTGADASKYRVLYRARLRVGHFFYVDSQTYQDGELVGPSTLWSKIPQTVFDAALQSALAPFGAATSGPDMNLESIWVSIVPRCPSEGTAMVRLPSQDDVRHLLHDTRERAKWLTGRLRLRWSRR